MGITNKLFEYTLNLSSKGWVENISWGQSICYKLDTGHLPDDYGW